ncbi:MAG: helix-turn-helix transcriptional regulator [Candidatus Saccharibacteria bacterium]|nr:helix-turn-helix transcriptional regulator [Microbacteriaceae bacterium]
MVARGEVKSAQALGRILQQGRLLAGLTQRDLADRLETDQKYVWALESGKNTILLERIFAIMRETGVRMYMEVNDSPGESHDGLAEELNG